MKKHTKFSILNFALAAGVSLLVVLAAPAGADFFTQVIDVSQQQCPVGQMFCGTFQQCTTIQQCNSADTAMGIPTAPPMMSTNNQSTCPLPNMTCGVLNFQCVSKEQCEAASGAGPANSQSQAWSQQASGGCPSGQFKCVTLGSQCATFADCDAADQAKFGPPPTTTTTQTTKTTPTTNQNKNTGNPSATTSCSPPKDICAALNFQCVTIEQCNAAQPFTGPISPFNNLNSSSVSNDNPFDVSTFGDKEINIPKLPSSTNLKNAKTLNTLIKKTTGTKSNEEAMGKILSITKELSDICDSSNLKCAGRNKLSTLIEEAAFDGLDSKNMKKIKKAFGNFAKAFNKESVKKQKSSTSSAKKKK